jgi:uncharacterized membrane protein YdbT with pleckstrin-like domain
VGTSCADGLGFIQSAHILAIYVVILVFTIVPKLCLMVLGACALVLVLIALLIAAVFMLLRRGERQEDILPIDNSAPL